MSESRPVLWTAWCDYYATGEGRTVMGRIGYAQDEAQCRRLFGETFDAFYEAGCEVAPGVVRNDVTKFLWPASTLDFIERSDGAGMFVAQAKLHFNFS